jgi:Ca2+-binding EF-hand superfamily protein
MWNHTSPRRVFATEHITTQAEERIGMTMHRLMTVLAVTALVLGTVATALAQPAVQQGLRDRKMNPEARWQRMLEHLDADNSGTISQDEFPGRDEIFAKIDANSDGQISQDEAAAVRGRRGQRGHHRGRLDPGQRWQRMLERLDADGSGTISQNEFPGPDEVFARIDTNDDGHISQDEAVAMRSRRGQGGPHRGRLDPGQRWQRMLERLDADNSGTISQDEFPGCDEVFARIDADGDGQITKEEAAKAVRHRRGARGGGPGAGPRGTQ